MGAAFNLVRDIAVTGFVADDDPNTTDPGTKAEVLPPAPIDAPLSSARSVGFFHEFSDVGAGTISFEVWVQDDKTKHWAKTQLSFAALANNDFRQVQNLMPGSRFFFRVTALAGGAGSTCTIRCCPA